MRIDGRKQNELRNIKITPDYTKFAEGSILFEIGETKVLCNVTIEDKVPGWILNEERTHGWITAEYAMLPRSTLQRTPRATLRPSGRTMEIRRLIGRSLRTYVDLEKLGNRTCIVDCDVLQADGGTRTAAITGGYIALSIALGKLHAQGYIPKDTILTEVAAISIGIINKSVLLDLNYEEDRIADVDANIVMNGHGKLIEVQCSSEGAPFSRSELDQLLEYASHGIQDLITIQREILAVQHYLY